MPIPEIEEFAQLLVQLVRDVAVQSCDSALKPISNAPRAHRWRAIGAAPSDLSTMIPDVVDDVVFQLLHAIDNGDLRVKFVSASGREIDLSEEGDGELSGWYMGSGGWRSMFSGERFFDDTADLT